MFQAEGMHRNTRPPAVAGMFYPEDPDELRRQVQGYLNAAWTDTPAPKAIIVPHAGYIYSGPVAASAYATLLNRTHAIDRVVLLGPDHRVGFTGMATPASKWFATPLGKVPVDRGMVDTINRLPWVREFDAGHTLEHSLEVQLPFLQLTLERFDLAPVVVSRARPVEVAKVLDTVWGGAETLIVVSSDLSHYHDYTTAQHLDRNTTAAIEQLHDDQLGSRDACGYLPVRGLLQVIKAKGLHEKTLDVRNSGDTAGSGDQVVGYGAYAFH